MFTSFSSFSEFFHCSILFCHFAWLCLFLWRNKLEEMVSCMIIPCVDCSTWWFWLAGWLELWLSCRWGNPGGMIGAEVGMGWHSPGLFAQRMPWQDSWSLSGRRVLGHLCSGTWQGGWSRGRCRTGCPRVLCLEVPQQITWSQSSAGLECSRVFCTCVTLVRQLELY